MEKLNVGHGMSKSHTWWDFHTQPHAKLNRPHRVLILILYKGKKTKQNKTQDTVITTFNKIKIKPNIVKNLLSRLTIECREREDIIIISPQASFAWLSSPYLES